MNRIPVFLITAHAIPGVRPATPRKFYKVNARATFDLFKADPADQGPGLQRVPCQFLARERQSSDIEGQGVAGFDVELCSVATTSDPLPVT